MDHQDPASAEPNVSLLSRFRHAKANPLRMMSDIAGLWRSAGRMSANEYFDYRLWDDQSYDSAARQTFLGVAGHKRINDASVAGWLDIAGDELTIRSLLQGYGLPAHDGKTNYQPCREAPALAGAGVTCVRVLCLVRPETVEVLRACWMLPSGNGLVLAGIDLETGAVTHAVQRDTLGFAAIDRHPDTALTFEGARVPQWQAVRQIVTRAAATVPNCTVQSWDVALCDKGPVLKALLPGGGDPAVLQSGWPTGLLAGSYARFARQVLGNRKRKFLWRERWQNISLQASNLKHLSPEGPAADKAGDKAEDKAGPGDGDGDGDGAEAGDGEFKLDADIKSDGTFANQMQHAITVHNANMATIIGDIVRVFNPPNRLPPNEYFLYKLWDEKRFDAAAKKTFIGTGGWITLHGKIPGPWRALAEDKLAVNAILKSHGLPITETQAIYHKVRHFPDAETLPDKPSVCAFLRERARYPLFGKPVGSQLSLGSVSIEAYLPGTDQLQLADGNTIGVEDFVGQITQDAPDTAETKGTKDTQDGNNKLRLGDGYLFQSKLKPHREVARIAGPHTGTVRMVLVSDDAGIELIRASWKVPGGDNVADNVWRTGNMLAGIDLATGAIMHVVRPGSLEHEVIDSHPTSQVSFSGKSFPEWQAMLKVATAASALIHNCRFLGWDIALCETGPVIVELQAEGGNPVLAQLGYDKGLLTGRYAQAIDKALKDAKR